MKAAEQASPGRQHPLLECVVSPALPLPIQLLAKAPVAHEELMAPDFRLAYLSSLPQTEMAIWGSE